MRVLGIDCGTERTGWGVIDSDGRQHRVLGLGVIRTAPSKPLEQRLASIAQGLRAVLESHQPDSAAEGPLPVVAVPRSAERPLHRH